MLATAVGWSVSYQLVRAAPLSADERAAVAAHAARFAHHRWPVEPYAPIATTDGTAVVRGSTKMPWSTTAPSWTWLLAALTELRALLVGTSCEVSDDHEAIAWSEPSARYVVAAVTIPTPGAARTSPPRPARPPRAPRPPGTETVRCVRVEPHQPRSHVVIREDDVPRFELRGPHGRLQANLFVRTAIATTIERATARLFAADGTELAVVDRASWSGFALAPTAIDQLAVLELEARTAIPCQGFPVARLATGDVDPSGAVTLSTTEGWPRYPRGAFALTVRHGGAGLTVDCDGRDEQLLIQRDLAIDFIVFTAGGAELARASVIGGLADRHQVEIELEPDRLAQVRRFDVRVTGTVMQTARVGRWQLVRRRSRARAHPM